MMTILQAEHLKRNGGETWKLVTLLPLLSNLIAFLLVGPELLESFAIYWWEALFLNLLIALLVLKDNKMEELAGGRQNIKGLSITFNIYLAKMMLIAKDCLIASGIFLLLLYGIGQAYIGFITLNLIRDGVTLILMLLVSLWTLPFLYLLSQKIGYYISVLSHTLFGLLIAPLLARTSVWFALPYTYTYKISEHIMGLKPSGDVDLNLLTNHHSLSALIVGFTLIWLASLLFILKERGN